MSNTTDVKKEPAVCRTCLNVITGLSFRLHENSGLGQGLKFTHILRYIVPELYLGLSQGPEICQNCKQSLKIAYTFRKKCLETETLIGNYLKNVHCTAQVVDLSAVINYLRVYKTSNVQNILSEWNDDSCEDSLLAEMPPLALLGGTNTTPSTETADSTLDPPILTPEVVMTPIPDRRSAINNPLLPIVQKAAMQTSMPLVDTTLLVPQVILGAISEASTSKSALAIPRDPKQISDATSGASNSAVPISKSPIPRDPKQFLICDENKPVGEQKEAINPVVKRKESNKENNITRVRSTTVQTQQTPIQVQKVEPASSGIREKTVELLKVCPETGLFKSKAGRYFNSKGQMLSYADVKALQAKTEERVQSILQKADAEMKGTEVKGIRVRSFESLKEKPKTHEKQIESKKISKETREIGDPPSISETTAQIHQTTDAEKRLVKIKHERKENSLNVCEETGLLKDQDGHYFDFYGNPLEKDQVEAERKKAKIRGETLFQISNICTVTDEDFSQSNKHISSTNQIPADFEENIDAHQIPKDKVNTQMVSNNQGKVNDAHQTPLPTVKENDKFVEMVPTIPLDKQRRSLLKSTLLNSQPASVLNFMADKNLRIPQQLSPTLRKDPQINHFNISGSATDAVIIPVKIKEEPVDPAELKNLLDNTSCGNVDIERTDSEETLSAPDLNDGEMGSWQNLINSLDSCENSQYVDVPDFVQINNFTFEDLERLKIQSDPKNLDESGNHWFDNLLQKKLKFIPDVEAPPPRPYLPDTFTYRGKRLVKFRNGYKFEDPLPFHISSLPYGSDVESEKKQTSSKSGSLLSRPIKERKRIAYAARGRRRRLRIVPVSESVKAEIPSVRSPTPDREICVLFTNYTEDGIYINDHDYLTSPYVRNNLLYNEKDGKSYCMCYICGEHHLTDQHVSHMMTHESRCDPCCLNLGTPYMLNMHMKIHAKPCKYCTDVIPYPDIENHAKRHEAEEAEQEEDVEPRGRKKKNKYDDDEEVHFPGVTPIRRGTRVHLKDDIRRSTRNRTRTVKNPDDATEARPRRRISGNVLTRNTRLSSIVSPGTSRNSKRTRIRRGDNPVIDVGNVLTTPTVIDGIFNEPMIIDNMVTIPPVLSTTPILADNTLITPVVIDSIPSTSIIFDDKQVTPTVVQNVPSTVALALSNKPTIVEDTPIVIEDSSSDLAEHAAESFDFDAIKEHILLTNNLTNPYVSLKKMAVIETFWVKKMNNVVLPDTERDDISEVQEISTNETVAPTSDNDGVTIVPEDNSKTKPIEDLPVDTLHTTKVEDVSPDTPRKSGRIRRIVNEKPIEIDDAKNSSILHKHISVDPLLDVKKVATYVPHVPKRRGRKPKSFFNNDSSLDSQDCPVFVVPDNTIKTTSDNEVVILDPVTENLTGTTSTFSLPKKRRKISKNIEIKSHVSAVIIVPDDIPTTTTDDVISIDLPTSLAVDTPKVKSITPHAQKKREIKSQIESNESAVIVVSDDNVKTTTDDINNIEPSTEIAVGIPKVNPLVIHLPKKRGQKPIIFEDSHSKTECESTITVASDDTAQTTTDEVNNIDLLKKVDDSFQNISKTRSKRLKIAEPIVDNSIEVTTNTIADSVRFTDRSTNVPVHIDNSIEEVPMKRRRKLKIIDNSDIEQDMPVVSTFPETTIKTTTNINTTEVPMEITKVDNSSQDVHKERSRRSKIVDVSNTEIKPQGLGAMPTDTTKMATNILTITDRSTDMDTLVFDISNVHTSKKKGRKQKIDQNISTDNELLPENVSIIESCESPSVSDVDSKNDTHSTVLATDSVVGTLQVKSSSKKKEKIKTNDEEIQGNVVKSRMLRSTSKKIVEGSNNAEAATTEDATTEDIIIKTNETLQIVAHRIDSRENIGSLHHVIHITENIQSGHTTESIDFFKQTTGSKQPKIRSDESVQIAKNTQTEVDTTRRHDENNDSQKIKDNNENEAMKLTR